MKELLNNLRKAIYNVRNEVRTVEQVEEYIGILKANLADAEVQLKNWTKKP